MFSTFSGALTFSTTTEIIFRNIHLQCAEGCFACSLFSFTSYIVPSSHVWPRFTAMESLPSLSRETSSQFESSLTTSMRSFVTRLSVSCYMTPPPPCQTRLQSHREFLIAQRRELWNRQNCPICLHQKDRNSCLPPLPFLFFLYSSTVYLYKSISLELLIKTKRWAISVKKIYYTVFCFPFF